MSQLDLYAPTTPDWKQPATCPWCAVTERNLWFLNLNHAPESNAARIDGRCTAQSFAALRARQAVGA